MMASIWIKERLKERSTRLAISAIAGSLGWMISPEQIEIIAPIIVMIAGTIESLIPDKGK